MNQAHILTKLLEDVENRQPSRLVVNRHCFINGQMKESTILFLFFILIRSHDAPPFPPFPQQLP